MPLPPPDDIIVFKSAYPPGSEWCFLSNLARREFFVDLQLPHLSVKGTFSSVEALYQGLKFDAPEQFAIGGALEGEAGMAALEGAKPGSAAKVTKSYEKCGGASEGVLTVMISRCFGDALARLRRQAPPLALLDRPRPNAPPTQLDAMMGLLACQLTMLSQNADARELLLKTGDALLEEYTEEANGELWTRFRPADGTPPKGQNANGQNLMHARALLRAGGVSHAADCAKKLFAALGPSIAGEAVMSAHALSFYEDKGLGTYAALLETLAPISA